MATKLTESTLTRLMHQNEQYECAMLTAFRQYDRDGNSRSKQENNRDNLLLGKALRYLGYGTIAVIGTYAEQMSGLRYARENSWFAVNLHDDADFFSKIIDFGESSEQDSVLLLPKGAFFQPKLACLYGTNADNTGDDAFVKWHSKRHASDIKFSKSNEFLTQIGNKFFYFKFDDALDEHDKPIFSNMSNAQDLLYKMKKKFPFMFTRVNN